MGYMGWNRSNCGACPCRECAPPKREPGCHDRCPEFMEWRREIEAMREAERREQESRDTMSDAKKRVLWRKRRFSRTRTYNRYNDR